MESSVRRIPGPFYVGYEYLHTERWYHVEDHASESRRWLSSLPEALARRIGQTNALDLLRKTSFKTAGTRVTASLAWCALAGAVLACVVSACVHAACGDETGDASRFHRVQTENMQSASPASTTAA